MNANLGSLLVQDFPAYEVIFVVDDPRDPARPVIDSLIRTNAAARLLVADKALESGQKVENLRTALLHADGRS